MEQSEQNRKQKDQRGNREPEKETGRQERERVPIRSKCRKWSGFVQVPGMVFVQEFQCVAKFSG